MTLAPLVHTMMDSHLGPVRLVAEPDALTALYFPGHKWQPEEATYGPAVTAAENPALAAATEQLTEYFAGRRTVFDLPLAPRGNEFQQRVWAQLCLIPFGETITYGTLATRLNMAGAAQAVGAANARNPISIVIPCHRVIGADGSLTGYAGGLDRKRQLLELEGALDPSLF